MPQLLAHQKQYVLGPKPVRIRPDWICADVAEGLVLSHCPKLRVTSLQSSDGVAYRLLGLAVPADAPVASMAEAFSARHSSEIEDWTGFWAGKWLLVSCERCWQDASGCRGVNYRHARGGVWLSGSAALLGDHLPDVAPAARIPWQVMHGKGMDWVPPPLTTRTGIHKLLPQRWIDPRNGSAGFVRFTAPDEHDAAYELAAAMTTVMTNWARCGFSRRFVALTAGLDTRTVLAAACASGIRFETSTTDFPFMDKRDRVLPPRLAARVGVPHRFRRQPPVDPARIDARSAAIAEHLDGITTHPVFGHLARFEYGPTDGRDRTSANGNCFEIGRRYFWHKLSRAGLAEAEPTADRVLEAFRGRLKWHPEPVEAWRSALRTWIDSLAEDEPLAMEWRDRFYLEQCLASWNSNMDSANDFLDSTGFSPANCLWIFHLLLRSDAAVRRHGALQQEAIRLMAPRLLDLPVNPPSLGERLTRVVRGVERRLAPRELL